MIHRLGKIGGGIYLCGSKEDYDVASLGWVSVNCKECLKLKEDKDVVHNKVGGKRK